MPFNADLLYQKYAGQSLSYDGVPANTGQCVQWAEYVLTDGQYGYGLQPFYGNAIDWWNNFGGVLAKNFDKISDGSIRKGDFVIFNQLVGSIYGHIDMAMSDGSFTQFTGADSNWGGNKTVHLVNHVGSQYVLGALRLKGNTMPNITPEALQDFQNWKTYGLRVQAALNAVGLDPNAPNIDAVLKDLVAWKKQGMEQQAELADLKKGINKQAVLDYINQNLS